MAILNFKSKAIFISALIRFSSGLCSGGMLLYVAYRAQADAHYSLFIYLQNLSVMIATVAKLGVDTLVLADETKTLRLGRIGSLKIGAVLLISTFAFSGLNASATTVAVICLSCLSVQSALRAALATRDGQYIRAALDSAWIMPTLLLYVLARQGGIQAFEITVVSGILFAVRFDRRLKEFLFSQADFNVSLKTLLQVWVFQIINLVLFRLDQTLASTIGARGGGSKLTADLLFWAKINDLANAIATALGIVANREEMFGRAKAAIKIIRWGFPVACLILYPVAWIVLSREISSQFLGMGICSLISAALSYEVNRVAFSLMWKVEYTKLIRLWSSGLILGGAIASYALSSGRLWLLPLAVTLQLIFPIAASKTSIPSGSARSLN
jgi:hypothetical protein